jgi:hypothetical protein
MVVTQQQREMALSIGIKLTKENDWNECWFENYDAVKCFIGKNGRYPSSNFQNKEETKLGSWIIGQRRAKFGKSTYRMNKERIKLLESLPNWKWNFINEEWLENFNSLKEFVEKNNRYPSQHSEKEKQLGCWVVRQKMAKKENGRSKITKERIELLESLPNWMWELDLDKIWNDKFLEIKRFIDNNKKFPSPNSKNKDENQLGRWIHTQKAIKKGKDVGAELSMEKIKLLESLTNWEWEKDFNKEWLENFYKLECFIRKNQRYPSSNNGVDEKLLNLWVKRQKSVNKGIIRGNLSQERIKLLESLPNWEWNLDIRWENTFNDLRIFILSNNGKYPTPYLKIEKKLYIWINNQKQARHKKKLNNERIEKLESLPNWKW